MITKNCNSELKLLTVGKMALILSDKKTSTELFLDSGMYEQISYVNIRTRKASVRRLDNLSLTRIVRDSNPQPFGGAHPPQQSGDLTATPQCR